MENFQWQICNKEKNISFPEWFESIAYAITVIALIFIFLLRIVLVSGASMEPTLNSKDRIAVQSSFYTPKNGDVIVVDCFTNYGKPLVKRIIGISGDTIFIDKETGVLSVNDTPLHEIYIRGKTFPLDGSDYPVTVPEGDVFVMGDNRANSLDSRSDDIGMIDERNILGKVLFRLMPFNNIGAIK